MTRIFLDSSDPQETRNILGVLGHLEGQTTNPSLIAKSPEAMERKARGERFTSDELFAFYRRVVQQVSALIPNGSVSIETYADADTTADAMLRQAREFNDWIPNAHIKFPTTTNGLAAAAQALSEGIRVNMTLVFSQAQAAAVYSATRGAKRGDVFLSPFVGRLDDRGERGLDLIQNIQKLYETGDGHVEILAASLRSVDHLRTVMAWDTDIATCPMKVLDAWHAAGEPKDAVALPQDVKPIPVESYDLNADWTSFDLRHPLTDTGLQKFADDWNALMR